MLQVKTFVFNPFQENTYLLYDESGECAIVDPGMLLDAEKQQLSQAIENMGLKPVKILQTHLHLDHVFGLQYAVDTYGLKPEAHADDLFLISQTKDYARQFGVNMDANPPMPETILNEGDLVKFGNTTLSVIHVPGHSPGGILFYNAEHKILVAGDVLFQGSVGRSDLPCGNHHLLIDTINEKLMVLPDDVTVFPGHGPHTTIGNERNSNPFL